MAPERAHGPVINGLRYLKSLRRPGAGECAASERRALHDMGSFEPMSEHYPTKTLRWRDHEWRPSEHVGGLGPCRRGA